MTEPAVKLINLRKQYNGFVAVDNVNLEINRGEIFGLLGPNGAGKTTTISMILGLVQPTRGDVIVDGYSVRRNPVEVRRRIGFLAENPGFYEGMTAYENLMLTARLNGVKDARRRIGEAVRQVGLADWLYEEVGKFSRGMKQRLGIADALIKDAKVLVLDEPTSGIDPRGAEEILELIRQLSKQNGITVIMSSHLLHQVEVICDKVAIMNRGRIIASGTLKDLIGDRQLVTVEVDNITSEAVEKLRKLGNVSQEQGRITVEAHSDIRHEVAKILYESRVLVKGLSVSHPRLYEIYRDLVS
ncbi:MAG TPA: ABC transporter ATP-binding protein [Candidatus Caldiarchaeum subterraneum]|uniref:ABC transporter ATP-binding protein n=1 Tax=Caldiarchaeum subterraneum TaxID=311458 RepID=A0A833ECS4_CALS0|nr:ABC transporter ATP-binding protein [Aigarchaeota archaeon]HIQ30110.1 ABC transporter ATP-binding protein [Candidatus Caldarchaeum subterraneum]